MSRPISQLSPIQGSEQSVASTDTNNSQPEPVPEKDAPIASILGAELTTLPPSTENSQAELVSRRTDLGEDDFPYPRKFKFILILLALCLAIFLVALVHLSKPHLPPKILDSEHFFLTKCTGQLDHFNRHTQDNRCIPLAGRRRLVRELLSLHHLFVSTGLWEGIYLSAAKKCLRLCHLPVRGRLCNMRRRTLVSGIDIG